MNDNGKDYIQVNKALWNKWTTQHVESDFYNMEGFKAGKTSLQEIELELLRDISGLSLLHLQCHFGQDSLSLARMGAKVTGVDLSDTAIYEARKLNDELGLDARFINCDLYSLPEQLDEQFDIVFTTYGTIGWLPDLDEWAGVVDRFLKPGGKFIFAEFHPVVWMHNPEFTEIEYSYFKRAAIIEMENGSYANRQAPSKLECISWNHSIDEPITALLDRGLRLVSFKEYPFSPYKIFDSMVEYEKGRYHIKGLEDKVPLVYSLEMIKA